VSSIACLATQVECFGGFWLQTEYGVPKRQFIGDVFAHIGRESGALHLGCG